MLFKNPIKFELLGKKVVFLLINLNWLIESNCPVYIWSLSNIFCKFCLLQNFSGWYGSNDKKQFQNAPGRRIKEIVSNCSGEGASCAVGGAGWKAAKSLWSSGVIPSEFTTCWSTWTTWTTLTTWPPGTHGPHGQHGPPGPLGPTGLSDLLNNQDHPFLNPPIKRLTAAVW